MLIHHNRKAAVIGSLLLIITLFQAACQSAAPSGTAPNVTQKPTVQAVYSGKKVLVVASYQVDFEWTAGIDKGVHTVLDNTGIELKFFHIDTKNHPEPEFRNDAAQRAKAEVDAFKPDLIITSDDIAVQSFVLPYMQNSALPILFTGVNWNATSYKLDGSHITGMLEVDNVDKLVNDLKPFAKGSRIGLVSVDNETERKTVSVYNSERYFNGAVNVYWVKTYADFKSEFVRAQSENDMVLLSNNGGITKEWDDKDAIPFFTKNTKVPTGSTSPSMTKVALIAVAKMPEEQGEWAGQTALRIFDGIPVTSIPVVENKKAKLNVNLDVAQQLGVVFSPSMLRSAEVFSTSGQK